MSSSSTISFEEDLKLSLIGFPQIILFSILVLRGNAVKLIVAILERSLFADPRIEFCSWIKIGFRFKKNANPIGTVIKPPNPTIASMFSFLMILVVEKILLGISNKDFILLKKFFPLKPS